MNITGYNQYSKQVAGIKDLRRITNQQQKLIFIYPILFADNIKVSNVQNFEALIRDFIAVTFLSDLFVQNTFNTIGLANQIRPLWDENREPIVPIVALIKSLQQRGGHTYNPVASPTYPIAPEYTPDVQQKINQKTEIIRQIIVSDPKMVKVRPFIEMITLGNMIDVPVVVGTAGYPVDSLTLMYTLIAAIGLNKSIDNERDVDAIFRELESMNKDKYWSLLNNLTRTNQEKLTLINFFANKTIPILKSISKGLSSTSPHVATITRNIAFGLQKRMMNPPDFNTQSEIITPILLNRRSLDQTKLYFKFVLDPSFAKKQFGIDAVDIGSKLTDLSQTKIQGELSKIQDLTMSIFAKLIGSFGTSIILSIVNLISIENSEIDIMSMKSEIIDNDMMEKINDQLNEILIGIDNSLKGSSSQQSISKIETLKDLCKITAADDLNDFMAQTIQASVVSGDFELEKFKIFVSFFNEFANVSNSLGLQIQNEIKYLVSESERSVVISHLDALQKVINLSLTNFFKPFIQELQTPNIQPRLTRVYGIRPRDISRETVPKFISGLTKIFYFVFLVQLQASLCKFISAASADIETAENEVTAWPNYTLVLPVEVISALHAAIMGVSWKHMLSGGQIGKNLTSESTRLTKEQIHKSPLTNVNETYTKGAVKFISQRINVPNLIVVDAKKGDIYYKLMNQTSVNKTKLATIETFVQSKLNRPIVSQF